MKAALFCRRASCFPIAVFALVSCTGCFSERSFRISQEEVVRVDHSPGAEPQTVREWTRTVHGRLEYLLPKKDQRAGPLTTEELTDANGNAVDVLAHFKKYKAWLHTVWGNLTGLSHTAQVTGNTNCIEQPAPPWDGFEDVWVPVDRKFKLSARLGWSKRNGEIIKSDCIVLLPGLLGDNMRTRAEDLGQVLRAAGYHVLSLEYRGHGRTQAMYPEAPYNFGVLETGDMLSVAQWLESQPQVSDTGIIAFSWSANLALLTAWENGRSDDHPSIAPRLKPHLRPRTGRTYFKAGIFCISPVLDFENLLDALDRPWSAFHNPVLAAVQGTINWRANMKGYEGINGSLRKLIQSEFDHSELAYPGSMEDGYSYLRLLPYKGKSSGRKLEDARVPVLILHASDDPLAYAQETADFFSETRNPNVAGIVLRGGGHDGFPAYARQYFFSLLLNFFDRDVGARTAITPRVVVERSQSDDKEPTLGDVAPSGSR